MARPHSLSFELLQYWTAFHVLFPILPFLGADSSYVSYLGCVHVSLNVFEDDYALLVVVTKK